MADIDMKFTPRIMIGTSVRLGTDAASYGDRALMVVDSVLESAATGLQSQLDVLGIKAILFAREGLSCHSEALDEALSLARGSRARMIISLGGEKVLSLGRLVAALAPSRDYAADVLAGKKIETGGLPLLELPSTGRHSLMFRKEALLSDSNSGRTVLAVYGPPPSHDVILDSALAGKTPQGVTELSAALRLGIAMESFLSPRATFLSEVQARAAVIRAVALVRNVRNEADHPDFRANETESLLLSAFSLGFTGPGPAHILAWSAAAATGMSRAAAYAVLLPWVLESPLYSGSPRASELTRMMTEIDEDVPGNPADEIRSLFGRLGLPGRLRDLGTSLGALLPAVDWAVGMAEFERTDFSESTFRDILEIAS